MVMAMAIRQVMESDISGKLNADTVSFGLGDSWYEIDLTAEEAAALEKSLKAYIEKGRKTGKRRTTRRSNYPNLTVEEREDIRTWGQKNGYEPAPYGALPKALLRAYFEEHGMDLEKRIEDDYAALTNAES